MLPEIEINEAFAEVLQTLENTRENIFITGKAGTGKSTLLQYFRENTRKNIAVLAPTGVSALNIGGQTIHSFFGFKPDISLSKVKARSEKEKQLFQQLDAIVIDEVSMVRADLLDCVDRFLRLNGPERQRIFGGLQLILFGDLHQLPPVLSNEEREAFASIYPSPYFFDAKSLQDNQPRHFELTKIYRQNDSRFISLLGAIRNNQAGYPELDALNTRCDPEYQPSDNQFCITLTTTNAIADRINQEALDRLPGSVYSYEGTLWGDFAHKDLPTALILQFKLGSQIMFLNNDPMKRWFNGQMGVITAVNKGLPDEPDCLIIDTPEGKSVQVFPFTWELSRMVLGADTQALESELIATYTQYPIRLAWAVTIHKSQGKTFNQVIIDLGRGTFSPGQLYVALSRCTTLEGITLRQPVQRRHILPDLRIKTFLQAGQEYRSLNDVNMPATLF